MNELSARIAARSYGKRTVLGELRLDLARREKVALVGPSGCGKSTLLRILGGLDAPSGSVVLAKERLLNGPDPSRVSIMFQEPRLLPWLTVAENVSLSAAIPSRERPKALSLLSAVGLAAWASAFPRQLSGGMAQRVALARALFPSPSVLLLDEPFSAVDAIARERLRALVVERAAATDCAVLLVTHDVDEALGFADRLIVMQSHPGRFVLDHPDVRLLDPANRERLRKEVLAALWSDGNAAA
jgi:sulfonate transport system ATP-binding protein